MAAQIARDTTAPAPTKDTGTAGKTTVTIEDVGTIEATSFQLGELGRSTSSVTGGSGQRKEKQTTTATITAKTGELSAEIMKRAVESRPVPKVVVVIERASGRITFTMTDVYFNVSLSGSIETYRLNFANVETDYGASGGADAISGA